MTTREVIAQAEFTLETLEAKNEAEGGCVECDRKHKDFLRSVIRIAERSLRNHGEFKSKEFVEGDIVLYKRLNSEHYELGEVKRACDDGSGDCFIYYHQGDTSARTPYDCIRRISNLYAFDVKRIRASDDDGSLGDDDD